MNNKFLTWLAIGIIGIIAIWALVSSGHLKTNSNGKTSFGAVGSMLAENYIPYVLYNGGYNSAKDLTITGTTTIDHSPDGFVLWSSFTIATSSTVVRAALTNNNAPLVCNGDSLYVLANSTGFTPAISIVLGTSTTATGYSANLMASTSLIGTSTSALAQINRAATRWPFVLANGSSITLSIGDTQSTVSSSTYYANISGEVGVHCWVSGN